MRKVLVLSAAVAAACASAAIVTTESEAAAPREPVGTATSGAQVDTAHAFIVTLPRLRTATYSYGTQAGQRLDAYWRPPEKGTRPGVLLLHGGYWLEGGKASWRHVARRLTLRGYTVFSADYRLSGAAPWPAQRDDAEAALAFVKRHAGHFKLDPTRIVVVGSSAGGQLAAMLGTYGSGAQRVRGVVALSPVNSPYLGYVDGALPTATNSEIKLRSAVEQLIGCRPQDGDTSCWQRMEDVAPATHASAGDAPMLLLHSADEFVPRAHSTQLATALKGFGVAATVQEVPGAGHGMGILRDPQAWRTILTWISSITKKTG